MYGTPVQPGDVQVIDTALMQLRRLWTAPPRGVDVSSILVLEACARHAQPASVGDVARFAGVEKSTASRLVDRAVQAGLVDRASSGRRVVLQMTVAGQQLRERALQFRTGWLENVLAGWPQGNVAIFAQLLGRFAEQVGDVGGPGNPNEPAAVQRVDTAAHGGGDPGGAGTASDADGSHAPAGSSPRSGS